MPGANPNVIKSEKLSNCFPIIDSALKVLATSPSKKSNNAPKNIAIPALLSWFSNDSNIAVIPHSILDSVIMLGILATITFIMLQYYREFCVILWTNIQ